MLVVEDSCAKSPGMCAKIPRIPGWEKEVLQGFDYCCIFLRLGGLLTIFHSCQVSQLMTKCRGTWLVHSCVYNFFEDISLSTERHLLASVSSWYRLAALYQNKKGFHVGTTVWWKYIRASLTWKSERVAIPADCHVVRTPKIGPNSLNVMKEW